MELNSYLVDTAELIYILSPPDSEISIPKIRMITYRIMASSAEEAMKKFLNEQGTVVYTGEPTSHILIGIEKEKS